MLFNTASQCNSTLVYTTCLQFWTSDLVQRAKLGLYNSGRRGVRTIHKIRSLPKLHEHGLVRCNQQSSYCARKRSQSTLVWYKIIDYMINMSENWGRIRRSSYMMPIGSQAQTGGNSNYLEKKGTCDSWENWHRILKQTGLERHLNNLLTHLCSCCGKDVTSCI